MWAELQSIYDTYAQIVQGERPWTALGDFLNYWHTYAADRRAELVHDPLSLPDNITPEQQQWAAFCAATVEYLCERDQIFCPTWVNDPAYFLEDAWFTGLGARKPHVQAHLLMETPISFSRHNVFCSPHAFATKYDVAAEVRQRQLV
ncbi:MAG: hypothetical protein H0V70_04100 [Ktedonobacteraceae bacterium]|nr:hypothetical protein [Ktedonobacteraceae bacterium]